jgi:hypothetical protein
VVLGTWWESGFIPPKGDAPTKAVKLAMWIFGLIGASMLSSQLLELLRRVLWTS